MKITISLFLLAATCTAVAQEEETILQQEQQMEQQTEAAETETEDDTYWQQVEAFRRHPLNLNAAEEADLQQLPMLNALQIASFLRYRQLLGKLVSLQELQAIPGWDLVTIRKLLPLVALGNDQPMAKRLMQRLVKGEYNLLMRASQVLEKAKGYNEQDAPGKQYYTGPPQRSFARYKYNYRNLLQYGVTTDKDAGERWGDFYSFHLFARKLGAVKAIALGDFTVNMGQGLIHWQSLSFKRTAAVLQVKRQSEVLRPYNSAGEYLFHRGAGITLQHKNWEATAFTSFRKLDANLVADTNTGESSYISSILTYGYHRTPGELNDRQSLSQFTTGGNLAYRRRSWHVGVNTVHYRFSHPFQSSGEPYDLFALSGKSWSNYSVDYSFTWRNLHVYGELAADQQLHKALLNGLLVNLHTKAAIAIVHRSIDKAYQSLYGNAFTENYLPVNEQGLYAGLNLRPAVGWQLDVYADFFRFPWLKYRVNAPGSGSDYLVQLLYQPSKGTEWTSRYRYEQKPLNQTDEEMALRPVMQTVRQSWRNQFVFPVSKTITLKNRIELLWYDRGVGAEKEKGFSAFTELFYKSRRSFSANVRLHYFETGGYDSRIYAYEQDLPYSFSIPIFQDKGVRYYINMKQDLTAVLRPKSSRKMSCVVAVRLAQFLYAPGTTIGSGLDELRSNRKTEIKAQVILIRR
jgi:DNA uptake protein ComE-like DNA-binding protein